MATVLYDPEHMPLSKYFNLQIKSQYELVWIFDKTLDIMCQRLTNKNVNRTIQTQMTAKGSYLDKEHKNAKVFFLNQQSVIQCL